MPPPPLRVGLVGAGPWAGLFHAPMLAASPAIDLVGVWARRPEQATGLAARHGAVAFAEIGELLAACDAMAFAVPPDIQAAIAVRAAEAGRHLLLDKPLGLDIAQARAVVDAAEANGVISQMVLTNRYRPSVRQFIADAQGFGAIGARAAVISGAALPGGYFATPWRVRHGALLDVGPHVLDLLDAALGPIVEARGTGDPTRWIEVTCTHEGGAVSQASLSITTPVDRSINTCELFGPAGILALDQSQADREHGQVVAAIPAELATAVASGVAHPLDAARGLRIQRLLEAARS